MPTEAYALCPRRPMPMSTSSFARKAIFAQTDFIYLPDRAKMIPN